MLARMVMALPDGWRLWWRYEEPPREGWLARRDGSREWFDARLFARDGVHDDLLWDEQIAFVANLCRRAPHPALPRVVTSLTTDAARLVLSEHLPGADLDALLESARRSGRRMPTAQAASIVAQVAAGLESLRRAFGYVHGRVDPSTIRVSPDGAAALRDPWRLATSVSNGVVGRSSFAPVFRYLAPELARGLPSDSRSDVYSLGIILYESVTGTRAFDAESDLDGLRRIVDDAPLAPPRMRAPELVPAFDAVIVRATAKRADARYQTPGELAHALAPWCAPEDGHRASPYRHATASPRIEADTCRIDRAVASMVAAPDELTSSERGSWWAALRDELVEALRCGRLDESVLIALTELRDEADGALRQLRDDPATASAARPLLDRLLIGASAASPSSRCVYVGAVQVETCARRWEVFPSVRGRDEARYCDACDEIVVRAEGVDAFALAAGRSCIRLAPR